MDVPDSSVNGNARKKRKANKYVMASSTRKPQSRFQPPLEEFPLRVD